jgi:hypothetical protein
MWGVTVTARNTTLDSLQREQAERLRPANLARVFLAPLISTCCPRACEVVRGGVIEIETEPEVWLATLIATGYYAEPREFPAYPTIMNGALFMLADELDAALKSGAAADWVKTYRAVTKYTVEFVAEIVEFLREQMRYK